MVFCQFPRVSRKTTSIKPVLLMVLPFSVNNGVAKVLDGQIIIKDFTVDLGVMPRRFQASDAVGQVPSAEIRTELFCRRQGSGLKSAGPTQLAFLLALQPRWASCPLLGARYRG
jgi:hypothetical protein